MVKFLMENCKFGKCSSIIECAAKLRIQDLYCREDLTKMRLDSFRETLISSDSCTDLVHTLKYFDEIRLRIPTTSHLDHDQ